MKYELRITMRLLAIFICGKSGSWPVCVSIHNIVDKFGYKSAANGRDSLSLLMNGEIKQKIGIIPENVTWGGKWSKWTVYLQSVSLHVLWIKIYLKCLRLVAFSVCILAVPSPPILWTS